MTLVAVCAAALEMSASILQKKRTDFERKEAASEVRRAEMEAEQKRHDELKRQAETAQEAERSAKYQLALAREEERKMVRGCGVPESDQLASATHVAC
jgi:hypothetical protein